MSASTAYQLTLTSTLEEIQVLLDESIPHVPDPLPTNACARKTVLKGILSLVENNVIEIETVIAEATETNKAYTDYLSKMKGAVLETEADEYTNLMTKIDYTKNLKSARAKKRALTSLKSDLEVKIGKAEQELLPHIAAATVPAATTANSVTMEAIPLKNLMVTEQNMHNLYNFSVH
jgi:hypothetical protein